MSNFKWSQEMFIDLAELAPKGQVAYQQAADYLNDTYNCSVKLENVKQQHRDILYTGGIEKFLKAFTDRSMGYSEISQRLIQDFYTYNPGSGGKPEGDLERQNAWIELLDTIENIEGKRKRYSTVRQYAQVRWGKRHDNHSYAKPAVHETLEVLKWPEYFFGRALVKCKEGHITEKSLGSLGSVCYFCTEDPTNPCYLYYVEITSKDDKIGISKDTNTRWPGKPILRNILMTRASSYELEQHILTKFSSYRTFCEEIKGNGWTETLCRSKRDTILNYFDQAVKNS